VARATHCWRSRVNICHLQKVSSSLSTEVERMVPSSHLLRGQLNNPEGGRALMCILQSQIHGPPCFVRERPSCFNSLHMEKAINERSAPVELKDRWETKRLQYALGIHLQPWSYQRRNVTTRNNAGELHAVYVAHTSRSNRPLSNHTYSAASI
jgi:hypothetical protein